VVVGVNTLVFDPDRPPEHVPAGANRLVWALAYRVHADHQPDGDGFCRACGPLKAWPCEAYRLARAGFVAAVGVPGAWRVPPVPPVSGWEAVVSSLRAGDERLHYENGSHWFACPIAGATDAQVAAWVAEVRAHIAAHREGMTDSTGFSGRLQDRRLPPDP
jgi:hypothetical protein